jgi:glutaredoxin
MTVVTLLTQTSCAFCELAKETLARLSQEQDFETEEIGLETEEGRVLGERHGILFAPGILVDGAFFSFGRLSERKLRRELQCRNDGADGHRAKGRGWRRSGSRGQRPS